MGWKQRRTTSRLLVDHVRLVNIRQEKDLFTETYMHARPILIGRLQERNAGIQVARIWGSSHALSNGFLKEEMHLCGSTRRV